MQNPLDCKERMTADDRSLFCTLGSVTLPLASQRSECLEMPASVCVKGYKSSINYKWMTVHARNVLAGFNKNTHVQNLKWKGSLKSFHAGDTRCSLERWPFCFFSCCDHPFIYPLKHSFFFSLCPSLLCSHSFFFLYAFLFLAYTRFALSKYSKLIRCDGARLNI